mmetsp:Transcript_24165/g.36061  ORF Transcript_24165/g.36061 Transcript_24165/m.36061 type:complete len:103 (+) Transcript_24165:1712-2020(+)
MTALSADAFGKSSGVRDKAFPFRPWRNVVQMVLFGKRGKIPCSSEGTDVRWSCQKKKKFNKFKSEKHAELILWRDISFEHSHSSETLKIIVRVGKVIFSRSK